MIAEPLEWPVYGMNHAEKSARLAEALTKLTKHHIERCESYARILRAYGHDSGCSCEIAQVPFIPVALFKEFELRSVPSSEVFKVLTSSGTTSQRVSHVVLDRHTSTAQTKALVLILQQFIGKDRLPMLIIDHPEVIKDRHSFSARGAGILGLSTFGSHQVYALKAEDMSVNFDAIDAFLKQHLNARILIFGFTFMVWKYFVQALADSRNPPAFKDAILIHSGGWKKLQEESVDNEMFKQVLRDRFNISRIHNFYGMVEQVGSIFVECEHGRLHAPAFADVLIRDARDWSVLGPGEQGLIQVVSVLPTSYPGHSLLTEDLGYWIGIDDCPCGRLGRTFSVHGRIAKSELRGCGDVHAAESARG